MDIRTYIESGILEQYILGSLSSEEAAEVENLANTYPSIKKELNAIEQALGDYAFLQAKTPPSGTLERILERINNLDVQPLAENSFGNKTQPRSWAKFLAVGMTVKFLAAATGLVLLYLQNEKLHDRIEAKQTQMSQAQVACADIAKKLEGLQTEVLFLKDVETRPVVMRGTEVMPSAIAAVYTNAKSTRTYLGNIKLPTPPSGKQYQLWAIVDGKPTDMGVFDVPAQGDVFIEVPFVANAQAFAISLEDIGGKPQPTMSQIFVLGKVVAS